MNISTRLLGPTALLGRLLLALVWMPSGFSKIGNFAGTQKFMESVGMPATAFMLTAAIVIEIVGAALLLVGYRVRVAAVGLLAFMLLATIYFHLPWNFPPEQQMEQIIHFSKNNAITGALLLILVQGAGPWSVDAKRSTTAPRE